MPLVVVREINCGRAVNYSSWVLKGLEHMLAPVRHTFIRAQSVPMGPLSVRPERPQPGNINDMDHKKRLFSVQGKSEDGQKERDAKREEKEGVGGKQRDPVENIAGPLHVK